MAKEVVVEGRVGGPFTISGPGLGTPGSLVIAGRVVPTTTWNDRVIKGELPADLAAEGEVTVTPAGDVEVLRGSWPARKSSGALVTVRTEDGSLVQGTLVTDLAVAPGARVAPVEPTDVNDVTPSVGTKSSSKAVVGAPTGPPAGGAPTAPATPPGTTPPAK